MVETPWPKKELNVKSCDPLFNRLLMKRRIRFGSFDIGQSDLRGVQNFSVELGNGESTLRRFEKTDSRLAVNLTGFQI